nr:hypothetical protein [Natronococcus sp. CG52]
MVFADDGNDPFVAVVQRTEMTGHPLIAVVNERAIRVRSAPFESVKLAADGGQRVRFLKASGLIDARGNDLALVVCFGSEGSRSVAGIDQG